MRNYNTITDEEEEEEEEEEEGGGRGDSWELARAFAEDTIRSTTWPPRSYTCSFCRREFRSAQALGGHMNVHRRDRARLHQAQTQAQAQACPIGSGLISAPADDSLLNNCYCSNNAGNVGFGGGTSTAEVYPFYNYQLDNYYNHNYSNMNHYYEDNFPPLPSINNSEIHHVIEISRSTGTNDVKLVNNEEEAPINEELDLELRLGNMPV